MKARADRPALFSQTSLIKSPLNDKVVLLLWLCFVLRGLFYCAILPLWEGYDEPFHFAFIQYVAANSALPQPTTPVSHEVQISLHVTPLSWQQRLHAIESPIYTQDSYWQLNDATRAALQQQLRAIPPQWGTQTGEAPAMYEAQQGPLYYCIMSLPLRFAAGWPLAARVLLIRALSILCASLLVPIAWLAALAFFSERWQAIGVVALIVCMPELMINVARASNECLGIVMYSLLTLLLLRAGRGRPRLFAAAGAVLGLGLLTKAYFLLAVPALLLIVGYCAWQNPSERRAILSNAVGAFALALLISFGWYWRNRALTGTWSGEENNVAAMQGGIGHVITSAAQVKWIGGLTSVLVSHVWFGGWSFLKLSKPVYLLFAVGMALALVGLLMGIRREGFRTAGLFVVLTIYGCFWMGLLYDILLVYAANGVSATNGWYMYAVILPELLLVAYGLYHVIPQRWHRAVLPALAASFAAIDVYGVAALLLPYYTGVIAHLPSSDVVRPASIGSVLQNRGIILERLTANKPDWLTEGGIALLLLLYVAATVIAVVVSSTASNVQPPANTSRR